jgi:hypothetical protein
MTVNETNQAFEAFGQQFLAQFAPLPPSRKRKATAPSENPTTKRQKVIEDRPIPIQKQNEDDEDEDEDLESSNESIEETSDEGESKLGIK